LTHRFHLILTAMVLLGGCAPATRKIALPPVSTVAPAPVPFPQYSATAEVIPAPIPTELPYAPPVLVDGVALSIAEARLHFDRGTGLYDTGFLKQARMEFDAAIDTLLESSSVYPRNDRIGSEITSLAARVHEMELAAIKNGDGFTDQDEQHAAIDDLVTTFPAPMDPNLRETVEADVRTAMHDLPIELNDRVLAAVSYYQNGRGRNAMSAGLERVGLYRPMIERVLKEEGVPLDLIYLAQAESAFLPRAISRAKARGMWQFISSRGKEYGLRQTWWIDERSDPEKSTRAAARHLSDLYKEFNDWYLAMAAYNSGPVRVENALKKTGSTTFWQLLEKKALPKETMNYVPTVLAMAIIGKNPGQYGFTVIPADPIETERVTLDKATDLRVIAEAIGVRVDLLKDLNPHVLRWTTPPDSEFELILPKGYTDKFSDKVATLPESERVLWRYHEVKNGETLSVIAKKYGVTVNDLTQANNTNTRKALQVGQSLLIPMSGAPKSQGSSTAAVVASGASVASGAPVASATPASRTPAPAAPSSRAAAKAATASYTVRQGDTLSEIAVKFSITVAELKKWNNLGSNRLDIGQKLAVSEGKVRQAN